MDKVQRVKSVINRIQPDRPPVSFWHHFSKDEVTGTAAVEAHLRHAEKYNIDFLKVMNDHDFPRPKGFVIKEDKDLRLFPKYRGDEEPFERQLELIRALKEKLAGEMLITTTVFSPWSVLRKMSVLPSDFHGPPKMDLLPDPREECMRKLLQDCRAGLKETLLQIAATLKNFTESCIEAGADGVFLSVRDDWVEALEEEEGTYDDLVREADREVCKGMGGGTFNMLHVCGRPVNLAAFAEYPVEVINWADRAAGPTIADTRDWIKPAICGGIDNLSTLVKGTPAECRDEVFDAIAQANKRPILVAPGCTYCPKSVPEENLFAVCNAVQSYSLEER